MRDVAGAGGAGERKIAMRCGIPNSRGGSEGGAGVAVGRHDFDFCNASRVQRSTLQSTVSPAAEA